MKKIRTDYLNVDKTEGLPMLTETFKSKFSKSSDCVFHKVAVNKSVTVSLIFIDGLSGQSDISNYILKPLTTETRLIKVGSAIELAESIDNGSVYFPSTKKAKDFSEAMDSLLLGSALIVIDDIQAIYIFDTKNFERRSVSIPTEENTLKGPKDAFVETLRVNTANVRRKMRTSDLVIEEITLGRLTKTNISISYIEGIVEQSMVDEVLKRLNNIETDQVLSSSIIEEEIVDNLYTPFPQIDYTEKPDKFCAALIEGRIGIMIDGNPFSMIIPCSIVNVFQTTDDYSHNFMTFSLIRITRYFLAAIALLAPAFYVAITSFHLEMIPEGIALSIISSEKGVPFPIFIECFIMILAFQVLIEAATRMWSSIGGMIPLVGALIVGEAAISAHFISPGVVVVVAASALANYALPNKDFSMALSIWRLIILMLSSVIGLYGMIVGVILLLHHLSQIETLGQPYLSPFASLDGTNLKDSIVRIPFIFKKKQNLVEQQKRNNKE